MHYGLIFGLEPWLLPPALEMEDSLRSKGHTAHIIYAQYTGIEPKAEDYNDTDTFEVIPRPQSLRRLWMASLLRKSVKKMIRACKPDVVIACDIIALQALQGVKGVKKGYWGFEIYAPGRLKLSLSVYRDMAFPGWVRNMDFFLAPSPSRLEKIRDRSRSTAPGAVIWNCRRFNNTPASHKPGNKLVYTGRVSATQYIEEMIDAMALLAPNIKLYIAGPASDEYMQRLKNKLEKEAQLNDRVFLLGRLSREEVYALNATADIGFVFYNEQECEDAKDPAPNKLSDYVAAGIWTLGGAQPYMQYWLNQRGVGLCIEPVDKYTIAEGVKKILTDQRYSDTSVLEHLYKTELNMDVQAEKLLALIGKV